MPPRAMLSCFTMTRTTRTILIAATAILTSATAVRAHHAFAAAFDAEKKITVVGVITDVKLANPHSWFYVDATEPDGKVVHWGFEAQTPTGLIRNGVRPEVFKLGSKVTVKGCRARDLSVNNGAARELVLEDGRSFIIGPSCDAGGN